VSAPSQRRAARTSPEAALADEKRASPVAGQFRFPAPPPSWNLANEPPVAHIGVPAPVPALLMSHEPTSDHRQAAASGGSGAHPAQRSGGHSGVFDPVALSRKYPYLQPAGAHAAFG